MKKNSSMKMMSGKDAVLMDACPDFFPFLNLAMVILLQYLQVRLQK